MNLLYGNSEIIPSIDAGHTRAIFPLPDSIYVRARLIGWFVFLNLIITLLCHSKIQCLYCFSYDLQKDPTFAKQLFSSLFGGIFHEVKKSKIPSEKKAIIQKLLKDFNHFLSTSVSYFPPFIACIQVNLSL